MMILCSIDHLIDNDLTCCFCDADVNVKRYVTLDAKDEDGHLDEAEVLQRQREEGMADAMTAAKTEQLITILKSSEKGVKSLIFSQVSFLFPATPFSRRSNIDQVYLTRAGLAVDDPSESYRRCAQRGWDCHLPVRR